MYLKDFSNERGQTNFVTCKRSDSVWSLNFGHLHLSVSVFVGVTAALALPAEFFQLGLAALDGLGLRSSLTLIFL